MARILLTWELGDGLGHLANLVSLHVHLVRAGHECDFALCDVETLYRLGRPDGSRVLPAPRSVHPPRPHIAKALTHADILHNCGYDDAGRIEQRIRAWRDLYALTGADIAVIDYAPTASLAARGTTVGTILASNPFSLPPDFSPLTPIRELDGDESRRVVETERRVLEHVNTALGRLGDAPLEAVYQVFDTDICGIKSHPEFDPFERRRQPEYWGTPIPDGGIEPPWPDGEGDPVFAYVRQIPAIADLLDCLSDSGRPVLVYAPETEAKFRQRWSGGNIRFVESAVDPRRAFREAGLVITHSGAGTGSVAVLMGCPVLLIPLQGEQSRMAGALVRSGAALAAAKEDGAAIAYAVERLLDEASFRQAASRIADKYAGTAEREVHPVVAAVERLLS